MFSFDIIFLRQLDTILLESKLYWWYCKDLMMQHYSMEISLILELMYFGFLQSPVQSGNTSFLVKSQSLKTNRFAR